MLVVAVVVFLIAHFTPGDPIRVLLGEDARPEQVKALRQLHGLDAPLPVQFGLWISRALRGDLGRSLYNRLPVTRTIWQHVAPTVMLSRSWPWPWRCPSASRSASRRRCTATRGWTRRA